MTFCTMDVSICFQSDKNCLGELREVDGKAIQGSKVCIYIMNNLHNNLHIKYLGNFKFLQLS